MENFYYLIYIRDNFIEGTCLSKKNNKFNITRNIFNFTNTKKNELDENIDIETNYWTEHLENFLDEQKWRDHPIAFIFASEEIIFRKIKFPFQEKKKVEQALPFELEEELIFNLSKYSYSTKVQSLSEQNSEALVMLIGIDKLKKLQKICFDRDLLIRNIDCSAYSLFRSQILKNPSQNSIDNLFQIYLGGDEAFINSVKNGHLDDIKIFPNSISEILQEQFKNNQESLPSFLENFSKHEDSKIKSEVNYKNTDGYNRLKEELNWLCSQFTLHLRIKNFNSESQIKTYGIFGPFIKWDGLIFRKRTFPIPEAITFAERSKNNSNNNNSLEMEFNGEKQSNRKIKENTPNTLQELMDQAKIRENANETPLLSSEKSEIHSDTENSEGISSKNSLEAVNPQASLLSMLERNNWSILGDIGKQMEIFFKPHSLSLYFERTPWRLFLKRNKGIISLTAIFLIIIASGFTWQKLTKYNLLKNEVFRAELLVKSEISKALPETSTTNIKKMLQELREKINNRKSAIQTSKKFEKREYKNLDFLKKISTILNEKDSFQVDSLELSPERFSISGTIDSYDSLQFFKKKLEEIDVFYGKRILESNRKSPDGIVYRILIELK